jgi:hypothetical protein
VANHSLSPRFIVLNSSFIPSSDTGLAELYRVPTKSLNLAVKRNADRFPEDFMFQLTDDEAAGLRFHFETSKRGRGGL